MKHLLLSGADAFNISLSEKQILQFFSYKDILLEWNKKINLTAITDETDIIQKHFLDSISILKAVNIKPDSSVIDVGTGAGFPGIPLKIARNDIKLTLMDSLNKRIMFLKEVCTSLLLEDVNCIHMRAEDGGQNAEFRENFDFCTSRAVAKLSLLSEYCIPFVKVNGYFIAMKGFDVENELLEAEKTIKVLGGKIEEIKKINIPNTDITHSIIIIKKVYETPTKYPRKSGKISKTPIK